MNEWINEWFCQFVACPEYQHFHRVRRSTSTSPLRSPQPWAGIWAVREGWLPDYSRDKFGLCSFQGLLGKMPLLAALLLGLRPRTSEQIMCCLASTGEDSHVSGEHPLPVCRAPAGMLFLHVPDQVQILCEADSSSVAALTSCLRKRKWDRWKAGAVSPHRI